MKKELDDKLCNAFPNLYADRHASMRETCMCWGFPSDGWFDIIWRLSEKLEAEILKMPEEARKLCKASQVKEKYASLRVYLTCSTDIMEGFISEAEKESEITCETCGEPGKMRGKGWYYTACDLHTDDKDKIKSDKEETE
jgi:hypothetical protein